MRWADLLWRVFERALVERAREDERVRELAAALEADVAAGRLFPDAAAARLFDVATGSGSAPGERE